MTQEGTVRKRKTQKTQLQNGHAKYAEDSQTDLEFTPRESPLTILIEDSLHIRAIYHIFVAILLVLLIETVIYDFVESGKINIGISTVVYGFGDVVRGAKLWFFEFMVAVSFYGALRVYQAGASLMYKYPGLKQFWIVTGIVGLVAVQVMLIGVPVWVLGNKHLAVASSIAVTVEMFRFCMKIHAAAVACGPRCFDRRKSLPTFKHYVYFLFAPTLIYRDEYPRTDKIRWKVAFRHFMEVGAIIFYLAFFYERFILPYWSDFGKEGKIEAGVLVRSMFACTLPGLISFLCGFYLILHAWQNAFAEMLRFADKLFYEEWWTSSQFSRYYRAWNRIVHSWLRDHIYKALAPHTGRAMATLTVFVVSAVAHEVVLALSFGFFYPVLLMEFGVLGLLMVPLTAASGRRFPSFLNLLMWLAFFIGNGMLWSLYPMEYFARKNCPPSESDSFFIPKSWSCPEVVLKPNWTFHNPLSII